MDQVKEVLANAGFFEGRSIDIQSIKSMYEEFGYSINELQKEFLEQYGLLEIEYENPVWKQNVVLRVNPMEAQKEISMDVVYDYNDYLKEKLLIIGDIERENMTLFLSESCNIFGCYDDCIIDWGNSFESMLEKLINGVKGDLLIMD